MPSTVALVFMMSATIRPEKNYISVMSEKMGTMKTIPYSPKTWRQRDDSQLREFGGHTGGTYFSENED